VKGGDLRRCIGALGGIALRIAGADEALVLVTEQGQQRRFVVRLQRCEVS